MTKLNSIIFPDIYPSLDLHGYDRQTARVAINDFILDNRIIGNSIVTIVHGVGSGILRQTTSLTLKKNKLVIDFKLDNFNHGMTLVEIDIKKEI
ncbi:MAG: Smr/MutS family protein [Bacilli bacterium]|nr:Smr/MutS family protein [Bacilli bacterium]